MTAAAPRGELARSAKPVAMLENVRPQRVDAAQRADIEHHVVVCDIVRRDIDLVPAGEPRGQVVR